MAATRTLRTARLTAALIVCAALTANGAISPSTESCDDRDSCSPSECVTSDMPTCNLRTNTAAEDKFAEEAAAMECKSCTASSSAKCTRAASLLKKDNIRAIYCNADFLVVWATGEPAYDANSTDYLGSIPLPPGGNDGRRAGDTCRVRTAKSLLTVYKIPLSPTQLTATQAASQEVLNSIPNVPGMPAGGACGMAIDGVPMFPNFNNRGQPTWESCEVDRCNAHAGKTATARGRQATATRILASVQRFRD